MKLKLILLSALVGGLVLAHAAPPAHAEISDVTNTLRSFLVNSTGDLTDAAPGDGKCKTAANTCTLRAGIQESNAVAGTDIVYLPPGEYKLQIAGSDDTAKKGDLDILDALHIQGTGRDNTFIDGAYLDRVFHVKGSKGQLSLTDTTVRKGNAGAGVGGGIWNEGGTLALWAATVRDSSADKGGGIYNSGELFGYFSTIDNNTAMNGGGGIFNSGTPDVVGLIGVSILQNGSATHGGGIWNEAPGITIYDSTFALNYANQNGGGFYNTWQNQTPNEVTMVFTTIVENVADADGASGGGGGGIVEIGNGHLQMSNTLVAANVLS